MASRRYSGASNQMNASGSMSARGVGNGGGGSRMDFETFLEALKFLA